MRRRATLFLLAAAAVVTIEGIGFAPGARGQQCPNPPVGPLQGTTGEFCLTQQEAGNVDFNQPVNLTTSIGPVTSTSGSGSATVGETRWRNPTWICQPCSACAVQPPPAVPPGLGGPGDSGTGFHQGHSSACTPNVELEYCLSMSQQGVQVMTQAASNCPLPPMPPPTGSGGSSKVIVVCPCPTNGVANGSCPAGDIPPCTEIVVPVTGAVSANVNYLDCTDTATWTDLQSNPQSKTCFIVRQRCIDQTVGGPYVCDTAQAQYNQMFGCIYGYSPNYPLNLVNKTPVSVTPRDSTGGYDPGYGGD